MQLFNEKLLLFIFLVHAVKNFITNNNTKNSLLIVKDFDYLALLDNKFFYTNGDSKNFGITVLYSGYCPVLYIIER